MAGKVPVVGILVLIFLWLILQEVKKNRAAATSTARDSGGCC